MAKDYARRYKNPPKKRKKVSSGSRIRSFFVLIIIVLVIAGGVYSYYYQHAKSKIAMATDLKVAEKTAPAPSSEAEEDPVNYEFYTLLPKMNVPDPKEDHASPDERPGFWLQLMVYYNMRDASAFVDRLQLSGLDPVITQRKSSKTDHDLFIVVLGPFTTKENALARQQDLKKININSYIFHIDPPVPNNETASSSSSLSGPVAVPVTDAVADA